MITANYEIRSEAFFCKFGQTTRYIMKDNFSTQAPSYAQFRPQYPAEMIEYVVSQVHNKETALDLATGNGQVAKKLSPFFQTVFATDISEKQLQNAETAGNLTYRLESAEQTGFEDNSFDLITVAQAVHWFDFSIFYKEVYRILKPGGIFAIMGYGLFSTNPRTDEILRHFYYDIVGPYWDKERKYIDENYQTIPFPFEEIETQKFINTFTWSIEQLTGYLDTWSATQHYKKKVGIDPVDLIRAELSLVWEKTDKKVAFPQLLRIGRPFRKF
jgi:ubiquinone/menaquinone biosynthesis C-methylase UbiE